MIRARAARCFREREQERSSNDVCVAAVSVAEAHVALSLLLSIFFVYVWGCVFGCAYSGKVLLGFAVGGQCAYGGRRVGFRSHHVLLSGIFECRMKYLINE